MFRVEIRLNKEIEELYCGAKVFNRNIDSFEEDRIVIFIDSKMELERFLDTIIKYKLDRKNIQIGRKKFKLKNISVKSVEEMDGERLQNKLESVEEILEESNIKKCEKDWNGEDKLCIEFISPIIFKVGSRFLDKFSIYIFFDMIAKKYNREVKPLEKIFVKEEEIKNILISERIKERKITLNGYKVIGFMGEIALDLGEHEDLKTLVKYGSKSGVGYKKDSGYGEIHIRKHEKN